ncbi:F-box domain-containing protein [Mycena sanguinolenta]|uniref:F-box domain-containing protein n=1 Tax=Mycena sanguinolenta TaxID=230812 RepID=A0A8H6YHD0_9AGAR|nr:F-box domain-containing protein [Mycena sanguinolenta]
MSTIDWDPKDGFPEFPESDFIRDLLRSHSTPPPNISSTVSFLAEELEKCDKRIAELEEELDRLETRREALAAYHQDCSSLLAPIRRLPPEILTDIFQLCRPSEPDFSRSKSKAYCGIAHLGQESLLWVSQVCVLWHTIVMSTPSLWTTISLHGCALRGTRQQFETTMELLGLAFERSGSLPLNVQFDSLEKNCTRYRHALELIASHSARWKSAKFMTHPSDFVYLSRVKGNLPLLTTLELYIGGTGVEKLDFLEFLPSVKNLTVYGSIQSCMPRLPLRGLVTYKCLALQPNAIASTVASMSRLSHPCAVHVEVDVENWMQAYSSGLRIPETSSNMSELSLKLTQTFFRPTRCFQTLEEIFAALTLPALRELSFMADRDPLPWPHEQFMSFSIRSSFHHHLHCLDLFRVHITESELVDCLSTLPALQELSIADRFPRPLVSDTFLTTLTLTPERSTCLVPHLRVLDCISDFRFDDNIYLAFLMSRCGSAASSQAPFVSRMRCSMEYYRRLMDANVVARIEHMCAQRVLRFEWQ